MPYRVTLDAIMPHQLLLQGRGWRLTYHSIAQVIRLVHVGGDSPGYTTATCAFIGQVVYDTPVCKSMFSSVQAIDY